MTLNNSRQNWFILIGYCTIKDSSFARQHYGMILQLFQWMNIKESELLYGIDHIDNVCNQLDKL